LDARTIMSIQRLAGNQAAARLVAREAARPRGVRALQRSGGLLTPQKVQEVYGHWLEEIAKKRGVNAGDLSLDQPARAQTKTQVGDLNFANWEKWEKAENAKIDEQTAKETAAQEPLSGDAQLQARHDQMWKSIAKIRAEVVQTEYLAGKVNFGGGVKGATARITAGGYTAMWGVGARTVSGVAEHVPMIVLSGVGLVFGSELAERTLVKQLHEVARKDEEMDRDIATAGRLVGGKMQAAYQATRTPYANWQAAFDAFTNASIQFQKDLAREGIDGFSARAKDITAMEEAEKKMHEAAAVYQAACSKAGIQSEAKALDVMGKNVIVGLQEGVGTAVMFGLPEVAPGLGELKNAAKGLRGMTARGLEKEVRPRSRRR